MATIIAHHVESGPTKNLHLLSLGQYAVIEIIDKLLTEILDAGGPQGISQLMILKDVMESISRGSGDDSERAVKRPCEVFHAIGGVGTGG
jgi:hypothetical protein